MNNLIRIRIPDFIYILKMHYNQAQCFQEYSFYTNNGVIKRYDAIFDHFFLTNFSLTELGMLRSTSNTF